MELFTLLSGSGFIFFVWHLWRYDRFRCLVFTRQDWFRALICHFNLLAICLLFTYGLIQLVVLYTEYFSTILGVTAPTHWSKWTDQHKQLWRDSLYILSFGWALMQSVHLEEFLYWAYLMSSIRFPSGGKAAWVRSVYFKVWVGGSVLGLAVLIGAVNIETTDLDIMRAYVFLVGGAMSTLFAICSTALCFAIPSFLRTVKSQGASYDVLDRLSFFSEMNSIRVLFRWLYSICFVILSADALSSEKKINSSPFASDLVFVTGLVSVTITACLSVILLLPRNMTAEALPPTTQPAKMRMVAYPRPRSYSVNPPHSAALSAETACIDQLAILGQRLNLDREAMGGMTDDLLELPIVARIPKPPASNSSEDAESTKDEMFKGSQSEENIFGQQAAMEAAMGGGKPKSPKRGIRWSEIPSIRSLERERQRDVPELPTSPRRSGRPAEVWIHTETVKHE